MIDHNLLRSRRKGVPSVVEFQIRWKGSYDDTWHEPEDFEHCVDTLCSYLNSLVPSMRKRVLRAFPPKALSFLPKSMQNQLS